MVPSDLPPTISVEKAAEILGISLRAAYRAANRGQIPTLRIGRRLLVPTGHLLNLLGLPREEHSVPGARSGSGVEDVAILEPAST